MFDGHVVSLESRITLIIVSRLNSGMTRLVSPPLPLALALALALTLTQSDIKYIVVVLVN